MLLGLHTLDELSASARQSPRLRKNLNLHASEQDAVQQFFNAIEPGSYVPPHRHLSPGKEETLLMQRGRIGVMLFDDSGQVSRHFMLEAGSAQFGVRIDCGVWHSVVSLQPGTVFFEVKRGPYVPMQAGERADWAPADGTPEAADYLRWMESRFA